MSNFTEFQAEMRPMLEAIIENLENLQASIGGQATTEQADWLQDAQRITTNRLLAVVNNPHSYLDEKRKKYEETEVGTERPTVAYYLIPQINCVSGYMGLLQIMHEKGEAPLSLQQQIAVEEIMEQSRQVLTHLRTISNEYWQKRGE